MTRFFITRPIFASVLSIIIVLAGLAAALQLPIAQYPQIAPPTVLITATFPGASAETCQNGRRTDRGATKWSRRIALLRLQRGFQRYVDHHCDF